MKTLMRFVEISRPSYWFYLFGPFSIGVAAGFNKLDFNLIEVPTLVIAGVFFLLPANMFIYGLRSLNTYKKSKDRSYFLRVLALAVVPFVLGLSYLFFATENWVSLWALFGFLILGYYDSRLSYKSRFSPFFKSIINVLYLLPGIVSYGILVGVWPSLRVVLAATAWCVAMHAFSAISTAESDKKLRIRTLATELGKNKTIALSALLYSLSSALIYPKLKLFALIAGLSYLVMMIAAYLAHSKEDVSAVRKLFPYMNVLLSASLLFAVLIG